MYLDELDIILMEEAESHEIQSNLANVEIQVSHATEIDECVHAENNQHELQKLVQAGS